MNDGLKSALDLAMEKLDKELGQTVPQLTDDQKKRISETRSRYQAKIAEAEISLQSKLKDAALKGDYQAVEETKQLLGQEKRKLEAKMEEALEKIRKE